MCLKAPLEHPYVKFPTYGVASLQFSRMVGGVSQYAFGIVSKIANVGDAGFSGSDSLFQVFLEEYGE